MLCDSLWALFRWKQTRGGSSESSYGKYTSIKGNEVDVEGVKEVIEVHGGVRVCGCATVAPIVLHDKVDRPPAGTTGV